MRARLVIGERTAGGESGGAWHGTLDGEPVIVKRGEAEARPRVAAVAALLDRLRARGVPTPSYTLLDDDDGELVFVQTVLPGRTDDVPTPALVEDVLRVSELLGDVPDVPMIRDVDWPVLLHRTLTIGEDGWCQHEPMRHHSDRTRRLLDRVLAHGDALDLTAVPTTDVVHLDLHHHNVLVGDDDRLTGIIDWDGVLPGDRWFDVVYFAMSAEAWVPSSAVLQPLYAAAEAHVVPALLGAYVAHVALRHVEWQLTHHTAADAEVRLDRFEPLLDRYPA
ncbi:MAG TPA: aminoglycoside phosphotransferase family protein [Acidimicrobiales bacterium]|nr:aminoglycoside phosphotransferase family protein [Acidimicrobiales bacterium]